jgi:hypothetical protein
MHKLTINLVKKTGTIIKVILRVIHYPGNNLSASSVYKIGIKRKYIEDKGK